MERRLAEKILLELKKKRPLEEIYKKYNKDKNIPFLQFEKDLYNTFHLDKDYYETGIASNKPRIYTMALDEDFLRKRSEEIDPGKITKEEITSLKTYCKKEDVFALASVQIGILKRIVYLKNTQLETSSKEHDEHQILINPTILKAEGLTKYWEACASCLDYTSLVKRPYRIQIAYQDLSGKRKKKIFEGFAATVLAHELDHLDGILPMDKALEIRWMNKEERISFRAIHGYQILKKTGNYEKMRLSKNR